MHTELCISNRPVESTNRSKNVSERSMMYWFRLVTQLLIQNVAFRIYHSDYLLHGKLDITNVICIQIYIYIRTAKPTAPFGQNRMKFMVTSVTIPGRSRSETWRVISNVNS